MSNYSENTTKTKLYKEIDSLELEFVYETNEAVFFAAEKDGLIYWLIEVFETGEIMVGSGLGEAKTVKMSTILDDVDEIKFNQSTIGTSTKKALETASSRVVSKMIKKGLFKN